MTLLERLRKVEPEGGDENRTRWYRNPDGPEAADEIERLQEELADAMEVLGYRDRDIEKFRKGTLAFTAEVERLQARVRELTVENARLRDALGFYAYGKWADGYPGGVFCGKDGNTLDFGETACAALAVVSARGGVKHEPGPVHETKPMHHSPANRG